MPVGSERRKLSTMDRVEFIGQIDLTNPNRTYNLSSNGGQLPNDRFITGLYLTFRGRLTNAASGNPASVLADGLAGLVDKVRVSGYHRPSAVDLEIINLSGAALRALDVIYSGSSLEITPSSLSTSANATNDFEFVLFVPFTPRGVHPRDVASCLLDAPNWSRLQLEIKWADDKSVFAGQTTASTFSAYGSTTGNPICNVAAAFAMEPAKFAGFLPGRIRRYEIPFSASLATTAAGVRLVDLPRGYHVRAAILKTGVLGTGVTSGNRAFSSLSDSILSNVKVNRGLNRVIAQYFTSSEWRHQAVQTYKVYPPAGYIPFDWVRRGSMAEALDMRSTIAGPDGDVDFFGSADVTGAANQAGIVIMEELISQPKTLVARR